MASYSSAISASTPKSGEGRPPPPSLEISESTETRGPCLRVFLVEDSASIRDRLGDFLSEPGKVEMIGFASTEADAVRQLTAQPVDVAIVDLNLKEGTGIGVIESVRALHATAPPTIVVLDQLCLSRVRSRVPGTRRGLFLRQVHAIRRGEDAAAVDSTQPPLIRASRAHNPAPTVRQSAAPRVVFAYRHIFRRRPAIPATRPHARRAMVKKGLLSQSLTGRCELARAMLV